MSVREKGKRPQKLQATVRTTVGEKVANTEIKLPLWGGKWIRSFHVEDKKDGAVEKRARWLHPTIQSESRRWVGKDKMKTRGVIMQ